MRYIFFLFLISYNLLSYSPQKQLSLAKNYFLTGNYKKTIELTKDLPLKINNKDQLLKIYELLGVSYYFENDKKNAAKFFRDLLAISIDFKMDPLIYPAPLVTYFDEISKEYRKKLDMMKEVVKKDKDNKNNIDQKEKIIFKEIHFKEVEHRKVFIEKNPYFSVFIPFGYSQYRNGEFSKAYVFFATESLLLLINVLSYYRVYTLKDSDGYYKGSSYSEAKAYQTVQTYSLIAFFGMIIYGVLDGIIYYRPIFEKKIEVVKDNPVKVSLFKKNFLDLSFEF